jgi:hypothetical protein
MDEGQMKPKLLVVGDSFMHPDADYPGQHWSEMLPDYEVLMFSQSGSSNGMIAYRLYQGLELKPDAVILGFTESSRIEFEYQNHWITSSHNHFLNTEQKLLADLYKIHAPEEISMIKDCSLVRGLLSILEQKKIPYAWTLNLLFNNLKHLPYPSDPWVNTILGDFFYRMTPTNLATYQGWKHSPGFHTDDPVWQKQFADESNTLLQSIDFLEIKS